jgi:O-antigen/teichoic acid export membrane protein
MAEPDNPKQSQGSGGGLKRRGGRARAMKPTKYEHTHPGGSGAAIGAHLAKYSGFQGVSLLLTNLLHYASLIVVARFLGASSLGSYALLFFLTGAVAQAITLVSKPGTMMRTFGVADDDADDVEEDEDEDEGSMRPTYTLGVGLIWATFLAGSVIALVAVFMEPIASFLLHDPGQANVVLYAAITGGVWAIFKLASMVIWFEGRPLTFALVDAGRPGLNLIAIVVFLSLGAGVEGAIAGQALGTVAATMVAVVLIWGSFQRAFSFGELKQILKRGAIRVPIGTSMWIVQNMDVFLLSRFVGHKDIGLYTLASRTGFMVAFLPQGFRMALRPIRKSAAYEAFRREYSLAVANGQLLAYFYLITLTAILAMVLGGEILIAVGGGQFASVAALVPLTAAAMSMPALFRTIAMTTSFPNKRKLFVSAAVFVAVAFLGLCVALLAFTDWGIYAPPAAMIVAFMIPSTAMFALSQRGDKPIDFPYVPMIQATLVACALAVAYHFAHPPDQWAQLPVIALVMVAWVGLLFLLRVVPEHHWSPIGHIARSAVGRGSVLRFDKQAGLRSIDPGDRSALRTAVRDRLPDEALVPAGGDGAGAAGGDSGVWAERPPEGARLVRLLRRVGGEGGVPIAGESDSDADISLFLFSDQPVAVRLKRMRELLATGADAHELRTLEDLRNDLATCSDKVWELGAAQLDAGSGGGRGRGKKRGGGKGVGADVAAKGASR